VVSLFLRAPALVASSPTLLTRIHVCERTSQLRWTLASPCSGSFATYPLVPHQSSAAAAFNITVAAARAARAATAARVIATAQADAARAEAAGAQRLAAQAVAAKEESEKDLFARFAHVMNAQKQRFRILVEELEQAKACIGLEEEERARTSDEEAPDELTRPGGTQPTQSQRLREISKGGAKELVLQHDGGGASMPVPDIYSSQRHFSQQQPAGEAAASPSKRAAGSAWGTQAAGGDGDDDLTTSAVARKPRVAAKKKVRAHRASSLSICEHILMVWHAFSLRASHHLGTRKAGQFQRHAATCQPGSTSDHG
jgi:DNA double-strand break repair and V(D)J recombination protein XRCC4